MSSEDESPPQVRYRIAQALRALLRQAPAVHARLATRVGVGVTDLLALDHVTSDPAPLGVVELADRLRIRSASATVLVDRLAATGHLQRLPHPHDRRRTSLHPTASAHEDVLAALGPLIRDLTDITDSLEPDTARAVLEFLDRVNVALERFARSDPGPDRPREAPPRP